MSPSTCTTCEGSGTTEELHGGPRNDDFARRVECEECDGRGHMLCCYCAKPAEAGERHVTESGLTEWRCQACQDGFDRVAARDQAEADYEGWCDAEGDSMRQEGF